MASCGVLREETRADNAATPAADLEREYYQALSRRASRVSEAAEVVTLGRAKATFEELKAYARNKEISVGALRVLDLESFVFATKAPVRAATSLQWMTAN